MTSVLSLFLLETRVYLLDLLNNVLFALFSHKEHNKSVVACIATDKSVDVAEFDGRDCGTAKDQPGWSRGSKEGACCERILEAQEGPEPAGLIGWVKAFYPKNINKPVKSFKQGSDMI